MLQTQSVYDSTLGLLKKLMSLSCLQWFQLVWGTALALYYGHRISVDLDFFTDQEFDEQKLLQDLQSELWWHHTIEVINIAPHTINAYIDGIKVDILAHTYPLISSSVLEDGIILSSLEDIGAMKLSAAAGRWSKKDFFDIYELLEHYTLSELLWWYHTKYTQIDSYHVLRALMYFDDADWQPDPLMIKDYTWSMVQDKITTEVKDYMDGARNSDVERV